MREVNVTKAEQKAIASLERLAKKWPKTLTLFSWSGSLCVFKSADDGHPCHIGGISGIPNDGGDPDPYDVDQYAKTNFD